MQAIRKGLDFFVATDHNVMPTAWPSMGPLVIPGMEITSSQGHFNAIGLRCWLDWRPNAADGGMESREGMNRIFREAADAGAIRSINHSMREQHLWKFHELELTEVDVLEVINCPMFPPSRMGNELALKAWDTLWNEGWRIPGIGGSDTHSSSEDSYREGVPPLPIGDPATYVLADCLSADAIMKGVRVGNVYVSRGPMLNVEISVGDTSYPIGSDLTHAVNAVIDGMVHVKVEISDLQYGKLYWIENGIEVSVKELYGCTRFEASFCWKNAGYVWGRLQVRDEQGEMLAFTNPIYYGSKEPIISTWGQLRQIMQLE
jgi:hypothetical protein